MTSTTGTQVDADRAPRRPVTDLDMERRSLEVDRFASPEDFRDYFKARYGPTIAAYRSLGDDPDRAAALDGGLAAVARRSDRGPGSTVLDWEYLTRRRKWCRPPAERDRVRAGRRPGARAAVRACSAAGLAAPTCR